MTDLRILPPVDEVVGRPRAVKLLEQHEIHRHVRRNTTPRSGSGKANTTGGRSESLVVVSDSYVPPNPDGVGEHGSGRPTATGRDGFTRNVPSVVSHRRAQQALDLGSLEAVGPATEVLLLCFLWREVLNSREACRFNHRRHFVSGEIRKQGNA